MLAAVEGTGAFGVPPSFQIQMAKNGLHSCDNWKKINSLERKTKHLWLHDRNLSCGGEDREDSGLQRGHAASLKKPLSTAFRCD